MPRIPLEKRVAEIEKELAALRAERGNGPGKDDWRDTIGIFTDNPGMLELFADAMKIREADRKRTRAKGTRRKRNKP